MPDRRQQLLSQLSAYLDDELSLPERAQVEALLADDAEVRRLLSELRATAEALRTLPRARAGDDLMDKLRARLEREALLGESTPAAAARTRSGAFRSGKLIAVAAVIALSFAAAYMMWPQGRQAALKQFALHTPERKASIPENTVEESARKAAFDEEARRSLVKELKKKETPSATPAAKTAAPAALPESSERQLAAAEAAKPTHDVPPQPAAPQPPAEEVAGRELSEKKVPPKPESLRVETDALNRTVERHETAPPPAPAAAPAPPAVAAAPSPAQPPTETKSESPPVVADAMGRDKAMIIEGPPAPPMQGGLARIVANDEAKAAATAPASGHGPELAAATPTRELGYFANSAPSQELGMAQRGGSAAPQMAVSTLEDGALTVVDLAYATPQDQQQALASIASQYPAQELADTALLSLWAVTTNAARQFEDVQTQPALALADEATKDEDSFVPPTEPSGSPSDQLVATAYEVVVPDESARRRIVDDLAKSARGVVREPAPAAPVAMGGAYFSRGHAATVERGDTSPSQVTATPPQTFDRAAGLKDSAQVANTDSAGGSESFALPAASQAAPARRQMDVRMGRAARPQSPQPQFGQQVMPASRPMGRAGGSQSNTLRLYLRVQPGQTPRMQQLPARPMQSPPASPTAPRP